jgi:hypothetical protein
LTTVHGSMTVSTATPMSQHPPCAAFPPRKAQSETDTVEAGDARPDQQHRRRAARLILARGQLLGNAGCRLEE